jgi:uncharacterized membrane protein
MNYQGQDPNQGQYPGSGQYGGYPPQQPQQPQQPQPTDPYSGQQYGTSYGGSPQQGGYGQEGYQQPNYGQQPGFQQPGYQQPNYGQQPGYQQPNNQQPGYQAPYGQPQQGPTSMGMSQNSAAGLSYLAGWITGLIFFLMEKQNRFVRFHAMQSIIFSGAVTILAIIMQVLIGGLAYNAPGLATALSCLWGLVAIGIFVVWILLLVNGFQGKYFKLPVIGDYAERYANQGL